MSLRALGVALVGVALVPATANATSRKAASTPRNPGVQLTWPSRARRVTLAPGSTVRVSVRSLRRGSLPVVVALARTDLSRARVVKQRRLRGGAFAVRLPAAASARYLLSARVGRRTLRRLTIVTPPPAAKAPAPAPVPPPAPGPQLCPPVAPRLASGTLTGDRTTMTVGETLDLTFLNSGPTCLQGGYGYGVERFSDGAWRPIDLGLAVPAVLIQLEPGRSFSQRFSADDPSRVPPGRYRLTTRWHAPAEPRPGVAVVNTWEFNLLPAGPLPSPDRCGDAPDSDGRATVALDRSTVTPGEQLALTIGNSGSICLVGDDQRYSLHRLADGYRAPVDLAFPQQPYRTFRYEPGARRTFTVTLPDAARLPLGRYVLSYPIWVPPATDAITGLNAEIEFDVVAPPD
ncbi:MAG TPA: immunoglobulin-like domain-containing protein [Conexibacter sp.]|nr:immunoglobulin-like domain-containing protein [Conexibacter sp.]